MTHQTEAACLLESGAIYAKRLLLRPASGGDPVFAGFKPGAFSLYFGDAPIYHFDREGRWQRAFVDGRHYLKGLDTAVQSIDRVREGENLVLKRGTLSYAEASDLDALIRATALDLTDDLASGRLERVEPPPKARPVAPEELLAFLERVARWDAAAWFAHRERYLGTYGPLPFLPPDCPSPVVLQATLGHEGGLTFGGAPSAEHYVRTPDEFEGHARAVAGLYGRRLAQCKAVFLAGGDVLLRPVDDVAAYLETVARVFPTDLGPEPPSTSDETPPRLDGVHAFLDRFTPPLPGLDAWRRFRSLGLVRVSVGIESGDPEIRAAYGKTWANDDLRAAVDVIKAAGVGVSPVVLAGAGGVEGAGRHLDATADLINSLSLGPGDVVSLLDAERPPESGRDARLQELKARLAPVRAERKAKVVAYNPEKQGLA